MNKTDSLIFNPIQSRWSFLNFGALFALVLLSIQTTFSILTSLPHNIPFPQSLVMARAPIIPGINPDHSLIEIALLVSLWLILGLGFKHNRLKDLVETRKGFFSLLVVGFFAAAIHEIAWDITWIFLHGLSANLVYALTAPIVSLGVLIAYASLFGFHKRELFFVLAVSVFYLGWAAIGFPVTDPPAGPQLFNGSMFVNGFEVLGWVYALVLWIGMSQTGTYLKHWKIVSFNWSVLLFYAAIATGLSIIIVRFVSGA